MNKRQINRIAAFLLALVMAVGVLPAAAGEGGASSVTLTVSAQAAGDYLLPRRELTVEPGLAGRYGYQNSAGVGADQVTMLDVLVAAHQVLLEDAFTPDTAQEYLSVTGGVIGKLFGEETQSCGFAIDGKQPHGDTWTEASGGFPGYFNAYSVSEAVVHSGEVAEFFLYQDGWGLDLYTWFEAEGAKTERVSARAGEDLSLTLKGYSMGWYGSSDDETIARMTQPVGGAQLAVVDAYGVRTDLDGVLTDEDAGTVSVRFAEPGVYTLSAYITEEDIQEYSATPIVAPWCTVTVSENVPTAEEEVQTLYDAFNGVYTAKEPLDFPYGEGPGEYTNAVEFLADKAAQMLPGREASEIGIEANMTVLPGTSGSGTVLEAKTMDALGNIAPVYADGPTKPALMSVYFTIDGCKSQRIGSIYLSVEPLEADAAKRVELEASAITWDGIRGKNTDPAEVTQSVGKLSGATVGALPNTPAIYKSDAGVSIAWSLACTGGSAGALQLESSGKTTVLRPNVGEEDGAFRLTATVVSKQDADIAKTVDFDLTVPAFAGVAVPFRVSPGDAELTVTDSYYKAPVAEKYIALAEQGALRTYTLHSGAAGGSQSFAYVASKQGYLTQSGSVAVSGGQAEPVEISLTPSTQADAELGNLEITAPAPGAASIKKPMEAFSADTVSYTATVGGIEAVTLRPQAAVPGAVITVTRHSSAANANKGATTNTKVSSGGETKCYLRTDGGDTVITVTVAAPEGSVQPIKERSYTLTVTRTDETHSLKALALTAGSTVDGKKNNRAEPAEETLSPALDAGGIEELYEYSVNYYRDTVTVKPTASDPASLTRITVNGQEVASGKASEEISLNVGNNLISIVAEDKEGGSETYRVNVRRKQPVLIQGFTVEGGGVSSADSWTFTANFPHEAEEAKLAFDIPQGSVLTVEGVDGSYGPGETVAIPVTHGDHTMATVFLSQAFTEDGKTYTDNQVYIIGLYRMAADAPSAVAAFLPAPGQFVNIDAWAAPDKTLGGPASGASVTLGSFGGSITYAFDEPIRDDPNNPFGVDFIVYGNAFLNSDGSSAASAAEPGAVQVSEDGETWFELAGSRYYDAATRHGVTVTYTNPDSTFAGAVDVPWTDSDGGSGVVAKNSFYSQPYYPNPARYGRYNTGVGANSTYTAESVSFTGARFDAKYAPAYGYGDVHASSSPASNTAVNPYRKDHFAHTNGDGMDLAWAVDAKGDPVKLSEVRYVRIYNPTLFDGGSTGEVSPEIAGVLRAKAGAEPAGQTEELTALAVNGQAIPLTPGVFAYSFDAQGAETLRVTPTGAADDNIYVNDTFVASGSTSPYLLAGDKLRVLVQNGSSAPVIYTITITGAGDADANAELAEVSVIPGELSAQAAGDGVYQVSIPYAASGVRVRAQPLSDNASVTVNGEAVERENDWLSQTILPVAAGGTESVALEVASADQSVRKSYTLEIHRAEQPSGGSAGDDSITVYFTLIGDSEHKTPSAHSRFETWVARRAYTVPKGAKVKYLTDMALINQGIDFTTDAAGTYISSIKGLAEFSNGPNSGWMYSVNGTYMDVDGYAVQTLADGDDVVWKYTDDYTKEEGMDKWTGSSGSGGGKEEEEQAPAATLTPEAALKEGIAEAQITAQALGQAAVKADGGMIEIAPVVTGEAKCVQVTLEAGGLAKLAALSQVTLRLHTALGDMTFSKQGIDALAEDGREIQLTIERDKETGSARIGILCGGQAVDVPGGVKLSLPAAGAANGSIPYRIAEDLRTVIKKSAWIDGKCYFIVAGSCEIVFQAYTLAYGDVSGHWAASSIGFAAGRELFQGTAANTFSPNASMTRGMLATVLYRLEDEPQAGETDFQDVPLDAWYAKAVAWAAGEEIVNGVAENRFAPDMCITREQLAAMLCRWMGGQAADASGTLAEYQDGAQVSGWAQASVAWAVEAGILTGKGNHRLDPQGLATRAEVAAMLERLIARVVR